MRLLSWNVNKRQPDKLTAKIKSLEPDIPHIVTLQEVKRNLADDWAKHLSDIGLVHHYRSGNNALALSHQCLIASCRELTPDDIPRPREPPYPESLGRAQSLCAPSKKSTFLPRTSPTVPEMAGGRSTRLTSWRRSFAK